LSGWAQPEDRERSLKAGFDRHLAKPPELEELLQELSGRPDQVRDGPPGAALPESDQSTLDPAESILALCSRPVK
jgi:CheY-like chemotaxis protein